MSLIAGKEDDTTRDRIFEDFSQFWSAFELSIEIIDRDMGNSEFLANRSPRLLREDMEEDSLHEDERGEFLRDKSRPFAHTTDTVVVSRFDEMETDKPHEKRSGYEPNYNKSEWNTTLISPEEQISRHRTHRDCEGVYLRSRISDYYDSLLQALLHT